MVKDLEGSDNVVSEVISRHLLAGLGGTTIDHSDGMPYLVQHSMSGPLEYETAILPTEP
jgi:hypothetical protein